MHLTPILTNEPKKNPEDIAMSNPVTINFNNKVGDNFSGLYSTC